MAKCKYLKKEFFSYIPIVAIMNVAISDLDVLELSNILNTMEEARDILANFQPIIFDIQLNKAKQESRSKHAISKSLIPEDFNEWLPLVSTPNGNCLFNSASILLKGDESLAGILHLLTVSELFGYVFFVMKRPSLLTMGTLITYLEQ